MLRARAAFAATAIARVSITGKQNDAVAGTPALTADDKHVQTIWDGIGRPPVSTEMIQKYGKYGKYSSANLAKVDTSGEEIVLNTYPEGAMEARLEHRVDDLTKFQGKKYDEDFFRKNILKPKVNPRHEDRGRVIDYAFNATMFGLGVFAIRYALMPIWWIGQPKCTMVAESNIEAEIGEMDDKDCKTIVWRGKPVYVYKRSEYQMQQMNETPLSALKHPETDEQRFPNNRNYAVCIAICTHLGCVPAANAGSFGGFFCPCHGSHYDASARIRQGPAPLNLEVPPHRWVDEGTIFLGQ